MAQYTVKLNQLFDNCEEAFESKYPDCQAVNGSILSNSINCLTIAKRPLRVNIQTVRLWTPFLSPLLPLTLPDTPLPHSPQPLWTFLIFVEINSWAYYSAMNRRRGVLNTLTGKKWKRTRPRALVQNQHTSEWISTVFQTQSNRAKQFSQQQIGILHPIF